MGFFLWAAAVASAWVAAGLPPTDPAQAEMAKLAGTWQLIAAEQDGHKGIDYWVAKHQMTIGRDGTFASRAEGATLAEGNLVLDPGRSPKAVDLRAKGGLPGGVTLYGIYELKGDEVRICYPVTGTDRPTEFTSGAGSRHVLMVYRRKAN
jgi:uncharacterized protein (TIGR03067 family)